MKRSIEPAELAIDDQVAPGSRSGRNGGVRTKLGEIAINIAVIAVLGVAAQQSVAGFRAVHGRQLAVFAPHQHAAKLWNLAGPDARAMPAAEIVFGPDGALLSAASITITDEFGNAKTIAFGPSGELFLQ